MSDAPASLTPCLNSPITNVLRGTTCNDLGVVRFREWCET